MEVNFVSKKFTLLPITIGICRSENIKKFWGLNFTFEICQGVNERIKVENHCCIVTIKSAFVLKQVQSGMWSQKLGAR